MAARQISVLGKQTFAMNFTNATSPYAVLGARSYDVRDGVSGALLVRVASTSGMPTGSSFLIVMTNTLVMPDDPATLYTPYNAGGATAAATAYVTVAAADGNFPRLYSAGWNAASTVPNGIMATFALLPVYGSAAGLGSITLAVDVVLRDT